MNMLAGLTLTPFEWTMTNDFSSSPMEFVFRVCGTGEIEEEAWAQAILNSLKQHPLLQANASVGPTHRKSSWRPASNKSPVIQWLVGDPNQGRGYPEDFRPIDSVSYTHLTLPTILRV